MLYEIEVQDDDVRFNLFLLLNKYAYKIGGLRHRPNSQIRELAERWKAYPYITICPYDKWIGGNSKCKNRSSTTANQIVKILQERG